MATSITPSLDFYYPEPGEKLNGGQYELLRHLGSGRSSTAWLAAWLKPFAGHEKYYAIKILTRTATDLHRQGKTNELALNRVIKYIDPARAKDIAKMRDDFEVQGFAGPHLCLVFDLLCQDVTSFKEGTPNKALKPYVVKKIVFDLLNALSCLHAIKIIHGGIEGRRLLFDGCSDELVEEHLAQHPPEIVGEFTLEDKKHFVYAACPLLVPYPAWDMSHYDCELIGVCLTGLGQGQWAEQTPAIEVVVTSALRPPEMVIKSHFGPEVDVWAVGCLTFELLVGESLFNPVGDGDEYRDTEEEDLLAQIFAITGQRFNPLSLNRDQCRLLDSEGNLLQSRELAVTSLEDRLASSNLLSESDVTGAAAFIRKCLQLEYSDRPAVEELVIDDWVWGWVGGGCN